MFPLKSESIIPPPTKTERRDKLDLGYILATYFLEKQNAMSVSTDLVAFGSNLQLQIVTGRGNGGFLRNVCTGAESLKLNLHLNLSTSHRHKKTNRI